MAFCVHGCRGMVLRVLCELFDSTRVEMDCRIFVDVVLLLGGRELMMSSSVLEDDTVHYDNPFIFFHFFLLCSSIESFMK